MKFRILFRNGGAGRTIESDGYTVSDGMVHFIESMIEGAGVRSSQTIFSVPVDNCAYVERLKESPAEVALSEKSA